MLENVVEPGTLDERGRTGHHGGATLMLTRCYDRDHQAFITAEPSARSISYFQVPTFRAPQALGQCRQALRCHPAAFDAERLIVEGPSALPSAHITLVIAEIPMAKSKPDQSLGSTRGLSVQRTRLVCEMVQRRARCRCHSARRLPAVAAFTDIASRRSTDRDKIGIRIIKNRVYPSTWSGNCALRIGARLPAEMRALA